MPCVLCILNPCSLYRGTRRFLVRAARGGGSGRAGFQLRAQNLYEPQGSLNPILVYAFTLAEGEERELLGAGGVCAKLSYLRF